MDEIDYDDLDRIVEAVDINNGNPNADEVQQVSGDENNLSGAEESKRVVKPKKRVLSRRLKLDPARLTGPRGIGILPSVFSKVKFKGKGYELEDLQTINRNFRHWAHRLYPKMTYEDCLNRIEELSSKRPLTVYLNKLRAGIEEAVVDPVTDQDLPDLDLPQVDPFDDIIRVSSPPPPPPAPTPQVLTDEQKERMERNKRLAEEKRKARLEINSTVLGQLSQPSQPDHSSSLHTAESAKAIVDFDSTDSIEHSQPLF